MYKRYEAETLKAALHKVKMDLGSDAVILSQREIRTGGISGILGKKVWQIVAYRPVSDEPPAAPKTRPAPAPVAAAAPPLHIRELERQARLKIRRPVDHVVDEPALPFAELPSTLRSPAPSSKTRNFKPYTPAGFQVSTADSPDQSALRILLKEVRALSEKIAAPPPPVSDQVVLPGVLPAFYRRLLLQEVPRQTALDVMNSFFERPSLDVNDETKALEWLEERLAQGIPGAGLDQLLSTRRPRILFLVGPAGVGKTTTLAKVSAMASRDEKMKIAFVTLDTFRVAAAEHLKTYADLIQADFEIVLSEGEFASAVVRHADKDLIFVDTPGKNPCSPATLSDFASYLKHLTAAKLPGPAVLLVLSAATRLADLQRYIACYRTLGPAGVIFTKMDETQTYGSLLPVLETARLPVVFLACGQDVPGDIEPANAGRIARKILGA